MNAATRENLLERLKCETSVDHTEVENSVQLMQIDTPARYMAVLAAFQGFWQGIESRVNQSLPARLQMEFEGRWRAERLREDLIRLGMSSHEVDQLPRCTHWPVIDSPAAALGAMYVIEGSTLGAKHISRHLHERLKLDASTGASFFSGHGDQTGSLWLRFKTRLCEELSSEPEQERAVLGARQTFSTLNQWFKRVLHHDQAREQ